jgi:RNA polymerase sigma-70 factor, ECF subfamily
MSDRDPSLERIIDRLQSGEAVEESFRLLCERYHRPLYVFFLRRGFPHPDCLDLTQETFLGIYRGIGSFRRDARFETWLFRVAANAWRKRLRREMAGKRSGNEVSLDAAPGSDEGRPAFQPVARGPVPGDALFQAERIRLLQEAVERLPGQMRRCLVLNVYHELKVREIAEVLHLSPETVKVHLFQARRRLQTALGPHFVSPEPRS